MGTNYYLDEKHKKHIGKRHSHNRWTFAGSAKRMSSYAWFQYLESLPSDTRITSDNGIEGDSTVAELVSYIKGAERSFPEVVDPDTPDFIRAHCWWDAWGYKFCRGEWC